MVRLDPGKDVFKPSLIDASRLNTQEFIRIVKKIRREGRSYNERYNKKIDRVIKEEKSGYRVHVIYVWEKCLDDDKDILKIKYVKKKKK